MVWEGRSGKRERERVTESARARLVNKRYDKTARERKRKREEGGSVYTGFE